MVFLCVVSLFGPLVVILLLHQSCSDGGVSKAEYVLALCRWRLIGSLSAFLFLHQCWCSVVSYSGDVSAAASVSVFRCLLARL